MRHKSFAYLHLKTNVIKANKIPLVNQQRKRIFKNILVPLQICFFPQSNQATRKMQMEIVCFNGK